MSSMHDDLMRDMGRPVLMEHFGERETNGTFSKIKVVMPDGSDPIEFEAIVGLLTDRYVETPNGVVSRQGTTVKVAPEKLPAIPLSEQAQVTVLRYPDVPFQVLPSESDYGGALAKLSLVRVPFVRLGNTHEASRA